MKQILSFTLNGSPVDVIVTPTETLLDVLREKLGVTGPKRGCDDGDCGTCTVLIDGEPVRSCLTIALTVAGKAGPDGRGPECRWRIASTAEGVPRAWRLPVRLLHPRNAHERQGVAGSAIPIPPGTRSGSTCPATCVAAEATKRSSKRSRQWPLASIRSRNHDRIRW